MTDDSRSEGYSFDGYRDAFVVDLYVICATT
jgi:hypothetical protein